MKNLIKNASLIFGAFLCGLLHSLSLYADDSQPLYVQITEQQAHTYQVKWRIPPLIPAPNAPMITLPEICTPLNKPALGAVVTMLYRCSESLQGQSVTISYPLTRPSFSTLVKLQTLSGEQHTRLLSPAEDIWMVPAGESRSQVARDYGWLGVTHIWAGTDHLLFLLCLLWIAGGGRRILITVTGFTIAHSITLVLSALEIIRLSVRPVEAVIALSIVFLATEIVKNRRDTLTWRYPIAVSSSFGLIHGLGFAAVLAEIGLPQVELYTGLLFFNIGVEIGQVVFVGAVILAVAVLKRLLSGVADKSPSLPAFRTGTGYMIGGLAAFWMVERLI